MAGVAAIVGLPPAGVFMSEFLILTSTVARAPYWRAAGAGLVIAFAALMLRLHALAFGAPRGPSAPVKGTQVPMLVHLALVWCAGVWLPGPLVSWFQHIAHLLG